MSLSQYSISTYNKSIADLPDRPNDAGMTAAQLKAFFDGRTNEEIKTSINGIVAALTAADGAKEVGVNVGGLTGTNVLAVLQAVAIALADRYTKAEAQGYMAGQTNDMVADVAVNLNTGVITVTKGDGTSVSYDTALEKVPASFAIVTEGANKYLRITNTDGTYTQTDVSSLIDTYSFINSDSISFIVTGSDNSKTVTAALRAGSVTRAMLNYDIVAEAESAAEAAEAAESNAQSYATEARNSANDANSIAASAHTAADTASSAKNAAETARTAAESAKTAAQAAASQAQSNMMQAQAAATNASAAVSTANSAAVSAEAAANSAAARVTAAEAAAEAAENSAEAAHEDMISAVSSRVAAETAKDSAESAKNSALSANQAAQAAATSASSSASSAASGSSYALQCAVEAASWAVGGTGTRSGEDTDNAKYYCEQAAAAAGGDYATHAELNAGLAGKSNVGHTHTAAEVGAEPFLITVTSVGMNIFTADKTIEEILNAYQSGRTLIVTCAGSRYSLSSTIISGSTIIFVFSGYFAGLILATITIQSIDGNFVVLRNESTPVTVNGGSTMTGRLTLSGDPTQPLHAATKRYVDNNLASHDHDERYYTEGEIDAQLIGKVDKVSGKQLSSNDFTDTYKQKLDGIASGADVNVQSDWNAASGDAFIKNKPGSMPASDVYSWAKQASKPSYTASEVGAQATITGGATTITDSNLTASRALISDANGKVAVCAVTATQLSYLMDVTSSVQAQLNVKVEALRFTSKIFAPSAWVASSTYTDYPWRADIYCYGVTSSHIPEVNFGLAEAVSGNFAPVALTVSNYVRIYAKEKPTTNITIPSIICTKQ